MKNSLLFTFVCLSFISNNLSAQIISQYYEGAGSDKWIEITNNTANVLTLDAMYIALFANAKADSPAGETPTNNSNLSGVLSPGASILFQNSAASLPSYASGANASTCNFNGDDLVIITTSNSSTAWANRVDVIGNGTSWGGNKGFYRNANINTPNTTYTTSEWTQISTADANSAVTGTTERLGEHVITMLLPVELSAFEANIKNNQTELFWQTSMELNNSHFEVQHSTDNRTFSTIEKVAGAGNSDVIVNYNATHTTPSNGLNYYRLQQFDFDGQSEYSQVVSVRFGKETGISVYPNPVQGEVTVSLSEEFGTNATAEIISQNGSTVTTQTFATKSFTQTINVADLPAGVYVLRVVNGNEVYTERFVKK